MNKPTFAAIIILLLLAVGLVAATDKHPWASSQGAPVTTPKYGIHWMPDYKTAECEAPVNSFSTKTVKGIIGVKSNGQLLCYVPRHRGNNT